MASKIGLNRMSILDQIWDFWPLNQLREQLHTEDNKYYYNKQHIKCVYHMTLLKFSG